MKELPPFHKIIPILPRAPKLILQFYPIKSKKESKSRNSVQPKRMELEWSFFTVAPSMKYPAKLATLLSL